MEELIPPQALDIERAVLGAMLFESEAIDIASEQLTAEAFYKPAHGIVFDAIKELRLNGAPVDQLTLPEELRKQGQLDQIGGEAMIASLAGEINSAANVAHHCEILNEKLSLRKLIAIAASVKSLCYSSGADPDDIAATLYIQSVAVMDTKRSTPYRSLSEIVRDAYDWLVRKANQKGTMGVSTGIGRLDKFLDGWQPGNLYVLAGKTGQGKSALAENTFALQAARGGTPTAVFSLEMSDIQIGVRMVSGESRMDLSEVQYNPPTPKGWAEISTACSRLISLPVYVDETPGINIGQMGAKIRRMQQDKGVKLVIVDYLQLMEGKQGKSREQEVASISRGLKLLAKSLKVPVIALSQFSRKADEKDAAEPQLSWLRESGAIEQDADAVIFIHEGTADQKCEYGITGDTNNIRELIIRKNRGGKTGKVLTVWKPEHLNFYDVEY